MRRSLLLVMTSLFFAWHGLADVARPRAKPTEQAQSLADLLADPSLTSVTGQSILLLSPTPHGKAPTAAPLFRFLIQGGLHPNEVVASQFVHWLAKRYAAGKSPLNALAGGEIAIDFLPLTNPGGAAEGSRTNAKGVNLNRNFGILFGLTREYPGPTSFSEPETRAIAKLMQQRSYTAAIDVHGYINWVVAPSEPTAIFTGAGAKNGTSSIDLSRSERYRHWRRALHEELRVLPGYQLKTAAALGDGGSFEDWAFWQQGTMAACLELEGLQRFVKPYRKDFASMHNSDEEPRVDLFLRYERFIERVFARAISIREAESTPMQWVSEREPRR